MNENLMVLVPMHLIERIQEELRLTCGTWAELDRCVQEAQSAELLPCDVRLPPATTFLAGTKISTMLMGVRMRAGRPPIDRLFKPESQA